MTAKGAVRGDASGRFEVGVRKNNDRILRAALALRGTGQPRSLTGKDCDPPPDTRLVGPLIGSAWTAESSSHKSRSKFIQQFAMLDLRVQDQLPTARVHHP